MKPYQHILVPVDFSQASQNSVQRAADLAHHYQAKLSLLHIVEDLSLGKVAFGGTKTLPMNATAKQNQINLAEDKLKRLAEVNELPANTELHVQHGKIEEIISQYIKQFAVTLVVICANGRKTGLGNVSLDTLTKQLQCEVLGIRPAN
jgi:universal stress protein A